MLSAISHQHVHRCGTIRQSRGENRDDATGATDFWVVLVADAQADLARLCQADPTFGRFQGSRVVSQSFRLPPQ